MAVQSNIGSHFLFFYSTPPMKTSTHIISNANQAVAHIAYKTNEVCPIYPITPASEMSELVEQWSSEQQPNIFGSIPSTFEMQSEAGVAGTMHGALQTGALSTTFTASQGLLLMLPNMYKIAGELTPNVIHVATRSIATHALSVFGDHSDIMAVRQSGYAFLGSASVQEAQDFALIAQAATLKSRIPFVHFFDGFRTSHEINKIISISDKVIKTMMHSEAIETHRSRALNPENPVIRGTSQGPDVFFQSREAVNLYYNACPETVQSEMDKFGKLTRRYYNLFDYVGHPKAEHVIVSMASSTTTIETTINQLNKQGEKYGLIKVRLFRPFSAKHLLKALPSTCKSIAVLDRTKEPGSTGEPLYLDIVQSISEAFQNQKIKTLPRIIGGRYGLSSKEFTPAMVISIFNNLKQKQPKNNFTIGITDNVTHLSLGTSKSIHFNNNTYKAIFYQKKCKAANQGFTNTLNHIGKETNIFVQGYTECDYKKSNSRNIYHLRIDNQPIKAPYLIQQADLIACQNLNFIEKDNVLHLLKSKGTLLVNTSLSNQEFWQALSVKNQNEILKKRIKIHTVNCDILTENDYPIINLYNSFLALKNDVDYSHLNEFINELDITTISENNMVTSTYDNEFSQTLLGQLLAHKGNDIPVSMFPVDGTYNSDTSQFNPIQKNDALPIWDMDTCTQCGACSMACPQAALRIKAYEDHYLGTTPADFKYIVSEEFHLLNYTVQINPEQCNGCNNCIDACSVKALVMSNKVDVVDTEKENWDYFKTIPELDRTQIDITKVSQQQLQEPLFKYSIGVEGCGEAPYLKLLSQLYGDRLLVANATGASSIFGGALPTTPWSKNRNGQGPAWSNSLFEDNAEFGLGYRLTLDQQKQQAKVLLAKLLPKLDFDLVYDIIKAEQTTETLINQQRNRVDLLKQKLQLIDSFEANALLTLADSLVEKSVWIVGGDGWAYDIGYGGLDHVLASGKNINILVLDNEVYDNTGGQTSKATPFGAEAKFSFGGKHTQKKDLGKLAMHYDNVYVASVAIGADQEQTLKAFTEAENFNGPSIIIAYCHSYSHGIDMKQPSKYHKAAVASGQWLLYRNDPRRIINSYNTLQLDSESPSCNIETYLRMEKRFEKLFKEDHITFNNKILQIQKQIDKRYESYLNLSKQQVNQYI
ncbi:4Fe-4S dicluster domain-containing protein [Flavobacteriaceae bacterium AU392]|nr:4Fe-4S dicluster domain-containing protein [Flavobacteriaceae bacterium]RKM85881.1 4Fe-4S dicluster domain-containing protein [Flavobacteriaceae bacterium AU392]